MSFKKAFKSVFSVYNNHDVIRLGQVYGIAKSYGVDPYLLQKAVDEKGLVVNHE